jgi:hypothetical protein
VSSLLIPNSLQNALNSPDVKYPPLYYLKVFLLFLEIFSTGALNSLNLMNTSLFCFQEIDPFFMREIINK